MVYKEEIVETLDTLKRKVKCLTTLVKDLESGTEIQTVENYSALPDATLNNNTFIWVLNSQGTSWLPGNLGGTYYNKGLYYSNGVNWEYTPYPYQATQSEVNTGSVTDKFVTPNTLANTNQWNTKSDVNHTHSIGDVTGLQTALDGKLSSVPSEYITESELTTELGDYVLNTDSRLSDARTPISHTHTASEVTDFDLEVSNNTDVSANTAARHTHSNQAILDSTTAIYTNTKDIKLGLIQDGATLNSSDAVLLNRANHTGSQLASTISDLQTAITNNTAVLANTAKNSYPIGDATKVGLITITQAVDLDTLENDTIANNAKVSNATHTGDVIGSTALTITDNVVNNAKLSDMAANTIKGRITASTGDPEDLTASDIRVITETETTAQLNTRDTNNRNRSNHTGTQLSSTISDLQETVEDIIGTKVIGGTNVTVSYNDTTGETTINSTSSAGYTNEEAQDAVGSILTNTTSIELIYDDASNVISAQREALTGAITAAKNSNTTILGSFTKLQLDTAISDGNVMYVGDAPTVHTHTLASITDVTITEADLNSLDDGVNSTLHFHNTDRDRANHTGTQLTSTISDFDSATRAQIEAALIAGTNITIVPSGLGASRQFTINASGGGGGGLTYSQILSIASLRV